MGSKAQNRHAMRHFLSGVFSVLLPSLALLTCAALTPGRCEEQAAAVRWVVCEKGKWGYIDRAGSPVIAAQFDMAAPFHEGLAGVRQKGKWGFIDAKGQTVVPPRFEAVEPFSGGLARVKRNGRWGFVDVHGRIVTPTRFNWAIDLHEGLALVEENGRYGYVDDGGRLVVPPRFNEAGELQEGLARVRAGNLWGFVDRTGKMAIDPHFDYAGNFHEGLAQVEKGGKHGYINRAGEVVIPFLFQGYRMEGFSEGLAMVVANGKYGFIDTSGKMAIPPKYWLAWGFQQGFARVQTDSAKWVLIDRSGEQLSRAEFDNIDEFREGFARVRVFRDYGFVGSDGRLSIPAGFTAALPFSQGLAAVYVGGSHRQLPVEDPVRRFDPMSPLFLYSTLPFTGEKVPRMGGGKGWGYIDGHGRFAIPPSFDFVGSFRDGLAEAQKGELHGYIDKTGGFVWKTIKKSRP